MKLEADEALWCTVPGHGSRRWPVILVHHDHHALVDYADPHETLCGTTDYSHRRIWIDASRTDASIRATLHHEVHHAVLYDALPSGVLRLKMSADVEEVMVRAVSPVLLRVFSAQAPPFPPEALAVIRAARRHRRRAA